MWLLLRGAVGRERRVARLVSRQVIRRRRPRGHLIALSGLDGAGKTSQCRALADSLERLGFDTSVEWTRLAFDARLDRLRCVARAMGEPLVGVRRPSAGRAPGESPDDNDPVKALRRRSAILTWAWAMVVALVNVRAQHETTRRHLRAGRVVVCDRYTLDSLVHLRSRYSRGGDLRPQRWMLRALSPRPTRTYLLDVSPGVARERKQDFSIEELTHHAALYRQEAVAVGAVIVDGERPRDEVRAAIVRDAREALA